jgi:hypothetical protein
MGVAGAAPRARAARNRRSAAGRRAEQARRLGDGGGGLLRVMQHLVEDHRVGDALASGSAYMSPWRSSASDAGLGELDAGEAQHLGRAVDAERALSAGGAAEQLEHPAGAGADVDQLADRPVAQARGRRRPRPRFGDVERAKLVPIGGVAREIAFGGGGAVGLDGGEAARRRRSTRRPAPTSCRAASNSGCTRSPAPRLRNTQLPSLRRSASPRRSGS